MRALALVIALLGACKINDVHFIGPNGDDDAHIDDAKVGDGKMMIDGTASGHVAYLFDTDLTASTGILHAVSRTPSGALTLGANLFTTTGVIGAVQDRTHTHLYALSAVPPAIRTYSIATDGTIMQQGADIPLPTSCPNPVRIVRSPDGNVLAIGCNQPSIITATLDASGSPTNVNFRQLQIGATTVGLAFSPNSQCLFVVDEQSNNGLHMFINNNGILSEISGSPTSGGPNARAIAVDTTGAYVFTANQNSIRANPANACTVLGGGIGMALTQPPDTLFVDPANHYVLAIGNAIDSFGFNAQNLTITPGSPFLAGSPFITGVTFDPQLSAIYLTSPGLPGVISAALDAQGAVTSSTPYPFPMAPHAQWLELGP
jgi:hypothetical protein